MNVASHKGEAFSNHAANSVAVLIVDDDKDIRDTIQELLEYEGYSVATAENGAAALDRLRHVHPQLILLDLAMPVMDGISFREEQMNSDSLAAIPTIVMSARPDPGKDAGPLLVRGCLGKPLDLEELLTLVAHYCRGAAA
jgi:two-component system, chemotaxis family, chemotaxis protein CheY